MSRIGNLVKTACLAVILLIGLWGTAAMAQDLEPRALSPAPRGLNIAGLTYTHSSGNVFFDKALLIEDATGVVHGATGVYARTFGLFGKSAKAIALVPFAWGDWEGLVDGEQATTSRRGFGDPGVLLAVDLLGAPAVDLKDFVAYKEGMILGASLLTIMPLGQYDPSKLINLGSNRWVFRPRLGFSGRVRRFTLEAMFDAYFFTENSEAYGGSTITQEPLYAMQANIIYSFRRGMWLALTAGIADGGRPTVNGVEKDKIENQTRLGGVLVFPFARHYSIKVSYTNSVRTKLGGDYDLFGLSFQYKWGGGL